MLQRSFRIFLRFSANLLSEKANFITPIFQATNIVHKTHRYSHDLTTRNVIDNTNDDVEVSKETSVVSDEVAKLLELSKPTFINGRYKKAKLSARKLAEKRKQMIAAGYYWPEKPMRDRSLDMMNKQAKRDQKREERQKLIEENMKKMPQMIAEYRAKMKELRAKKRELKDKQKEKQIEAQRLGYHPKDPRGLQKLLQQEAMESKQKKRMQKKAAS